MLPSDIVSTIPKPVLLAAYGIVATTLCLTPSIAAFARLGIRSPWLSAKYQRYLLYLTFALLFAGCFWFGHGGDSINFFIVMLGSAILFSLVDGKFDRLVFAAVFTTLFVSRMLIWWRQALGPLTIGDWEITQIAVILLLTTAVLNEWGLFRTGVDVDRKGMPRSRVALFLVLVVIAALVSFTKDVQSTPLGAYTTWHHWSVYVAPVELLRAGAVPFKDFTVQYGLGPTLLIDLLSGNDPWSSMPVITSFQLFLEAAFLAGIVCVVVEPKRSLTYFVIALIGCSVSCFTWLAWPPELGIATIAPSGAGMRYNPVLIQVLYILLVGSKINRLRFQLIGHFIWALASLWAPESFFYATAVWGPYYLWQQSTSSGKFELRHAVHALAVLSAVLLVTVALFLAVFWFRFATLPSWYGYFAYMIDEPAPLNMAVRGAVWTLVTILILVGITLFEGLRNRPKDSGTRNLFVTLCAALATLSIFIGRSHENNFLLVLPFFMVTVLCAASASRQLWRQRSCYALFACSVAYLPLINWAPWIQSMHNAENNGITSVFDSKLLIDEMSYATPEGQHVLELHRPHYFDGKVDSHDAAEAVAAITTQYHEPITMYDLNFVMLNGEMARGWNAIQDPAAFLPLSPKKRLAFIAATADRLRQPGWFVVNHLWVSSRGLLDEMDTAYDEGKQLEFGTYYAIRFVPKVLAKPKP